MKKNIITLMAVAFSLGAVAQVKPGVGIGTPKPAKSAILEIKAENKGVLIPRVDLPALTSGKVATYGLHGGEGVQGMLVYNNVNQDFIPEVNGVPGVANSPAVEGMPIGFYQWNGTKWERIVSQVEFETVIEKIQDDIANSNEVELPGGSGGDIVDKDGNPVTPSPGEGGGVGEPGHTDGKYLNVVYRDGKLYFIKKGDDGKNIAQEINIENLIKRASLETALGKVTSVDGDGNLVVEGIKLAELKELGKPGSVVYEFTSNRLDADGKAIKEYIDLGSDVAKIIKEAINGTPGENGENGQDGKDSEVGKAIQDAIDKYLSTVDNAFYGKLKDDDLDGTEVLYEKNAKGEKIAIDISQSVREVFEKIIKEGGTSTDPDIPSILDVIKDAVGDKLEPNKPVFTGDVVGGKKVAKLLTSVQVAGGVADDYDSDFAGEIAMNNYGSLLSVAIYNASGEIVINSVTDVKKQGAGLKFSFGSGNYYTPVFGGEYAVVIQYVSTEEAK